MVSARSRLPYEVVVKDGRLFYKKSRELLHTTGESSRAKWIFVLSTSKTLYIGKKKKGSFLHSSFLAGGAASCAGRLVVEHGVLKSPVAFVPIISCSGVGGEHHSDENGIAVDRWTNKRVLPAKQKVQVTVSLLVPESEYNANLGVFQGFIQSEFFNPERWVIPGDKSKSITLKEDYKGSILDISD